MGEEDYDSPETFGSMGTIKKKKKPVDWFGWTSPINHKWIMKVEA